MVILGVNGFVASAVNKVFSEANVPVLGIGREHIDLCQLGASEKLEKQLEDGDVLLFTSAKAPCKNHDMFLENIEMMVNACKAFQGKKLSQVIYISSDAVYSDSDSGLTETSPTMPNSLHGMMHVARELLIKEACQDIPLAILRPTLIYGANDPHNGYGPNQFRRKALNGEDISLFGKGEERRDHVYINDVAEIVRRCVMLKSKGTLNIATGKVISFHDIAQLTIDTYNPKVSIKYLPRTGPMPHNGYRPFRIHGCQAAFPDFRYTSIEEGLLASRAIEVEEELTHA